MNTETLEKPVADAPSVEVAKQVLKTTALAELSVVDKAIAMLTEAYGGKTYEVATTAGLDAAKAARLDVRERRYKVPHIVKAKKAELKQIGEDIDREGERITAALLALESPIDAQIKAEEERKAAVKAAKDEADRQARAAVQVHIDAIRACSFLPAGVTPAGIQAAIDLLAATEITLTAYGDRAGEAAQAKTQTLARLAEMLEAAQAFAAEQARVAAEKAELARQRTEQDAREAAHRAQVVAETKAAADKLAADRAAFAAEQAAAKAERDEKDRLASVARAADEKRLADARAELEAQQRAARKAEEDKAAAAHKVEQDRQDAEAATERKRLDDLAAVARAEQAQRDAEAAAERQRQADEVQAAAERADRITKAAPALLGALQVVAATPRIPKEVMAVVKDAIALATGETA